MRRLQTPESLSLGYLPENTGSKWLSKRGALPRGHGVGYTLDIQFDIAKVSTRQKRENMAAIKLRPTAERNQPRKGL
jgi:hypothetical protein